MAGGFSFKAERISFLMRAEQLGETRPTPTVHRASMSVVEECRDFRRRPTVCKRCIVIENPFNQRRTVAKVPLISELAPADCYDYILGVVRRNDGLPTVVPAFANYKFSSMRVGLIAEHLHEPPKARS